MVKKCREAEKEIHVKLAKQRVNPSREFFECPLQNIKRIFDKVEGIWWTDGNNQVKEDQVKQDQTKKDQTKKDKTKQQCIKKRRQLYRKVKRCILNYRV